MKIRTLLYGAVVLALVACGSGGGSATDTTATTGTPRTIFGSATKGPLEGASVSGQFLTASGLPNGARFDAGATDGNGNFSVDIGAEAPPFLRVDTGGGSYVDEADPAPENGRRRVEFDAETGLSAIFPSDNNVFPLNLVTQLLSAKSLEEASGGNFGQVFLANRQAAIEAIGFDVFNVVPADPLNPAAEASVQEKQYGMILGALAQALNRAASELGFAAPGRNLLLLFARDISDGIIDGREFGSLLSFGEGGSLPQDTDINAEIERFRNNNFSAYVGVPLARFDEVRLSQTNGNGNENQPPVAADDNYSVARSETLNVAAPGVLSNDTDPDDLVFTLELLLPSSDEFSNDFDASGSVVALEVLSPASAGEVILNDNGSFSYSHDGSRTSFDSFGYRLIDSAGNSDSATVSIAISGIQDIPQAVNDSGSTEPGLPVNINVVANDTGPVEPASTEVVEGPANGVAEVFSAGVFTYTPNTGFEGGDSFTYRVANSQGDFSGSATVSVSVVPFDPGNSSPQADSEDFDVLEDELAEFVLSGTDSDGSVASFEILSLPGNGTLFRDAGDSSLSVGDRLEATNNSRTVFYVGDQDFNGGDDFGFRVFDNGGAASQEAFVTINVIPVNDAPVIFTGQLDVVEHDNLSAPPGYDISEALDADDVDNSIDELIYTLDLAPTEGELALDGQLLMEGDSFTQDDLNQGIVEYFHFGDEPTDEFFDITVTDPDGDSDSGTVFIIIEPVNDPPVANDDLIDGGDLTPLRLTLDFAADRTPAWDPRLDSELILFRTQRVPGDGIATNIGRVMADGSDEGNADTGPNTGLGIGFGSISWVGTTGLIVINDAVSNHEYLEFDTAQAPFERTVENGLDAAHRVLLTVPLGGGSGFMKVSRDGSTAIWRVSNQGGGGTTRLRVAPYASLNDENALFFGTVLQETFTDIGAPEAFRSGTAIAPDGSTYVQAEEVGDGTDLFWRSATDGSLIRRLTNVGDVGGFAGVPEYSLGGRSIVFAQRLPDSTDGTTDLYLMELASGQQHQLTDTPLISESEPSFAPDGRRVAYRQTDTAATGGLQSGEADNDNIYVANFFATGSPLEGGSFTLGAPGVLGNDQDVDGDQLSVNLTAVTEPQHGTLTINDDGSFTYEHDGSENFTDQFEYEISDPDGETDIAQVDIIIQPVNDVPVAVDDSLATDEDSAFIEDAPENGVLGNDTDGEDDPLSVMAVNGDPAAVGTEITLPSGALLLMSADGTYRYNPIGAFDSLSAGVQGSDSFVYTVSDGEDEATGTVTATIDGINDAPMAADDIYTDGFPGQRITVDPNRDIQPAWDPRSGSELIIFRTGRSPGNPSVNNLGQSSADGSIPEGNLVVGSSALFGISAGEPSFVGTSGLAVLNRAQGAHSYLEVNADTGAQIRNVLTIPGGGGGGWMAVSRDGSTAMWRYSQSGGAGATELRTAPYGSLTGQSANAVGTVVVSINLGSAGEYSEAAALTPDGSAFVLSQPSGAGRDLFLRSSADGSLIQQLTLSGSISGVVNREPDISPDGQTVAFARNVPNGSSDVFTIGIDGSGLNQVTATDDASELDPSYAPDGLRLAIRRNDTLANGGHDGSLPDNNNIYVININGARAVGNGVAEGGIINAASPGVLANDTDIEGDSLMALLISGPANATSFTLNTDGSFDYSHDGSETTSDSFTYRAQDPSLAESGLATVTIEITPLNDPPVAVADSATTEEDNSVSINVLANDSDAEDGTPLGAITIAVEPGSGSVVIESDRTITYTPDQDFNGQDSFEYAVADADGAVSNNALVSLTVNAINDAPGATDDSSSTDEDTQFTVAAVSGLLSNDSDIDSVMLSIIAVNDVAANVGSSIALTSGATLTVQADGNYSYDPNGQYESIQMPTTDGFTYTVSDGELTDTATVTITITPVNDAPVLAGDLAATVAEAGSYTITTTDLSYTDPDDNDAGVIFTVSGQNNGSIRVGEGTVSSFNGTDLTAGNVRFVHDGSETITAAFEVNVEDGNEDNSPPINSTFSFTVTPVNDAPVLTGDLAAEVDEDSSYLITPADLGYTDPDDNDDGVTFTVSGESNGSIRVGEGTVSSFNGTDLTAGNVRFVHDGSETLTAAFEVNVEDGNEDNSPPVNSTFSFTVTPVNDAPVLLTNTGLDAANGRNTTISSDNLLADDIDNTAAELLYTVITESDCGNFTLLAAITDSFTQADIEAGDVGFLATGCAAGERSPAQLLLTDGTDGFGPFDFEIRALGLQVVAVQPAQGQEAAPANTNIGADFVDGDGQIAELAASSVNSGSVAFHRGLAGRQSDLTFDLTVPGQLRADPAAVLQPNEVVEVTYTRAIQSTSGLIADAFVSRFRVAAAGSGVGEFTSHPQTPEFGSGNAAVLASGDIDGDGDIDIALGSEPGTGSIWLNDGIGNYSAFTVANDWNVTDITSLVLGDIDGDGDLDAFIATADSALHLFVNDGNGLFAAHPSTPTVAGSGVGDSDVVLGDLDGDGDIDAVVSTFLQGSLILSDVYLNDGSGVFTPTPLDQASVTGGRAVALADINHDGSLDIIIGRMGAGTLVALNNGNAMFEETYLLRTEAIDIIVADFNGDGFADVAALRNGDAVDPEGEIHMLFNDGSGSIVDVVSHFNVGDYASFDAGDVDADGDLDFLLSGGGLPTVVVFNRLNEAPGGLVIGTEIGFSGAHDAASLADIDGDGDLDFVTTALAIEGSQLVWLNNSPPLAQPDALTTDEDSELNADLFADNGSSADADDDGDLITIVAVNGQRNLVGEGTALAGGSSLFVQSDGGMTLQPGASFESLGSGQSGSEAFNYTIADGNGGESTAAVTVTINGVNDAPVAVDDTGSTDEDTRLTVVAAAGLLANDSDVDSTGLMITLVDGQAVGSEMTLGSGALLTVQSDGSYSYNPNGVFDANNANSSDTFSYVVSDGGLTDTANVTITITPVNDAPVAVDDTGSTDEDTRLTVVAAAGLLANDSDVDSTGLMITLADGQAVGSEITLGSGALVTVQSDGGYSYNPNGVFDANTANSSDTFSYVVSDGGLTDTANVTITITPVNDAPVAVDDTGSTDEDTQLTVFAASGLLSNDSDIDNTTLSVIAVNEVAANVGSPITLTSGALLSVQADGGYSYDPNGQYESIQTAATDSFSYTVSDGGLSNTASVTITITPVNDAPTVDNSAATVNENQAVTIDPTVLQVSDPDSPSANFVYTVRAPLAANGKLVMDSEIPLTANDTFTQNDVDQNRISYFHNGSETTADSVLLSVSDNESPPIDGGSPGSPGSTDFTLAITVIPVNDAPVNTVEPTFGPGDSSGDYVLQASIDNLNVNDGSSAFTVIGETETNGNFATAQTIGRDAYAVLASGDVGDDSQPRVQIDGIIGGADGNDDVDYYAFELLAGEIITLDIDFGSQGVFVNTQLHIFNARGELLGNNDDSAVTDGGAGSVGEASEGGGTSVSLDSYLEFEASADGIYYVAVTSFNNDPNSSLAAEPTFGTGDSSGDYVLQASIDNLMVNDGSNAFSVIADEEPNGNFATAQAIERDAYAILASGNVGDDSQPRVQIDGIIGGADGSDDIDYYAFELLAGEILTLDIDLGDQQGVSVDTQLHIFNARGEQLDSNDDSAISDGGNGSVSGLDSYLEFQTTADGIYYVAVTSFNNDPQSGLAGPVQFTTSEDSVLEVDGVAIADADAGDGEITTTLSVVNGVLNVSGGTATVADNNSQAVTFTGTVAAINSTLAANVSYTPDTNFNGADSLTIATNDNGNSGIGGALIDSYTVGITVTAANDAPVAADDTGSTDEDTPLVVAAASGLLSNDSDIDGDTLSIINVNGPTDAGPTVGSTIALQSGALLTVQADGGYSYDPNGSVESIQTDTADSFSYTVSDGELTDTAMVTITITPVNDAPVAVDDTGSTDEDTQLAVVAASGLLANDSDVDSTGLMITSAGGQAVGSEIILGSGALLTVQPDGSYSYNPNGMFDANTTNSTDTFSYVVSDGALTGTANVTITITPVNDAPVAGNDSGSTDEDTQLTVAMASGLLSNDSDVDSTGLMITSAGGQAVGSEIILGSGALLTVQPDGSYSYNPSGVFDANTTNSTDTFSYVVSDGALTDTANVTITITPVNDVPVVQPSQPAITVAAGDFVAIDPTALSAADAETSDPTMLVFTVNTSTLSVGEFVNNSMVEPIDVSSFTLSDIEQGFIDFSHRENPAETAMESVTITLSDPDGGNTTFTLDIEVLLPSPFTVQSPQDVAATSIFRQPAMVGDGKSILYIDESSTPMGTDTFYTGTVVLKDIVGSGQTNIPIGTAFNSPMVVRYARASHRAELIAFDSDASDGIQSADPDVVVGMDGNRQIYGYRPATGKFLLISDSSDGVEFATPQPISGDANNAYVAADGQSVVFESTSMSFPGATNGFTQIYAWFADTPADTPRVKRVSQSISGASPSSDSYNASISANGRYIVYESSAADVVPNDTDNVSDIYIFDTQLQVTRVVSVPDGVIDDGTATTGDNNSLSPHISNDGQRVVFFSTAGNLVAGDDANTLDIFVKDLSSGAVLRINIADSILLTDFDILQFPALRISGDGRYVSFTSTTNTPSHSNPNNVSDIWVLELPETITGGNFSGNIDRLMQAEFAPTNGNSRLPSFRANGQTIGLLSEASNLSADDTDNQIDIFSVENPLYSQLNGVDSDGDALIDGAEDNIFGTSPYRADSDFDLLSDFEETAASGTGTDPNNPDTDFDDVGDGIEDQIGTDPLTPTPINNRYYVSESTGMMGNDGRSWATAVPDNFDLPPLISGANAQDMTYVLYDTGTYSELSLNSLQNVALVGGVADGVVTPKAPTSTITPVEVSAIEMSSSTNIQLHSMRLANSVNSSPSLAAFGSTVVLRNSEVVSNNGGGISGDGSSGSETTITLLDSLVGNNVNNFGFGAAGVNCFGACSVFIEQSEIIGNQRQSNGGGGIGVEGFSGDVPLVAKAFLRDSTVAHNLVGDAGGGLHATDFTDISVINSVFIGNRAGAGFGDFQQGGGIFSNVSSGDSLILLNSTLIYNEADRNGGALANSGTVAPMIADSEIYFNLGINGNGMGRNLDDGFIDESGLIAPMFNNVQFGSGPYDPVNDNNPNNPFDPMNTNNIDADPLHVAGLRLRADTLMSPNIEVGSLDVANTDVAGQSTNINGQPDTGRTDIGVHFKGVPLPINHTVVDGDGSAVGPFGQAARLDFTVGQRSFSGAFTPLESHRIVSVTLDATNTQIPNLKITSLTQAEPDGTGSVLAAGRGRGGFFVLANTTAMKPAMGNVFIIVKTDDGQTFPLLFFVTLQAGEQTTCCAIDGGGGG